MSGLKILDAWRALLPRDVAISAGAILDDPPELTPCEEKSAGVMDIGRMCEFRTGRAYAKLALSKLGVDNVELPIGANRAPIWPVDTTGSITHAAGPAGGHIAAAVARVSSIGSIGIDAEPNCVLHPGIWTQFLDASELQHVRALPLVRRAGFVLSVWCVKEAVLKALAHSIDPMDIRVWHEGTLSEMQDTWRSAVERPGSKPISLQARTVRLPDFVLSAVIARAGG